MLALSETSAEDLIFEGEKTQKTNVVIVKCYSESNPKEEWCGVLPE